MARWFRSLLAVGLVCASACGNDPGSASSKASGTSASAASDSVAPADDSPSSRAKPFPQIAYAVTDSEYLAETISLIDSAKHEILVAQFLFSYGKSVGRLQDALANAANRGVTVRVLLDEEVEKSVRAIPYLIERKIDAKLDSPEKRLHTKLVLVDRSRAIFGSTNWSDPSIEKTNESNLYVDDPILGKALGEYFASLWDHSERDADLKPVQSGPITLYFDRGYESALMTALEEAETIALQLYGTRYYTDNPSSPSTMAIDKVCAKAGNGRSVRAIIERSDYNESINRFNDEVADVMMRCGVEARRDPETRTSHSKMLLTDQGVLFGSSNWGYGAFREYHELNAFIADSELADEFRDYYQTLWDLASPGIM